jgi:hypothetical protein
MRSTTWSSACRACATARWICTTTTTTCRTPRATCIPGAPARIRFFFAENNFFRVAGGIRPDFLIERFNGKALFARRTFVNGTTASNEIDLVAAYNAVNSTDLSTNVGWAPTANQSTGIDPVAQIANTLPTQTGPIVW